MRSFYFMLSVWGDRFSDYFAKLCVPSLLAPGNIPSLGSGDHKFLIACPEEDWRRLVEMPSIQQLGGFLELVHIDIPPPPPGVSATVHMGVGHKKATHRCFEDGAFGVALTPDLILSDGAVVALRNAVERGDLVVLCAALRFEEERLFAQLCERGFIESPSLEAFAGGPLVLSGREMVRIGVPSFHSQSKSYYFDSPAFSDGAPAAIWRVPKNRGVLIHSLTWAPLLMDYAAVERHDTRALDEWTMDGDYVDANFGCDRQIHVVDDSDEIMLISWAPADDRPIALKGTPLRRWLPSLRPWVNAMILRHGLQTGRFDALKKKIFSHPVRWHVDDIDDVWGAVERRAASVVSAPLGRFDKWYPVWLRVGHRLRWNLERVMVVGRAIRGDADARDLIRLRFWQLFARLRSNRE